MSKDMVTREQVEAWAKLAGIEHFTEKGLERLGDFAIFARAALATTEAPTSGAIAPTEGERAVAYMMKHKTGTDVGLAWKSNDPQFSADWIRVPLYAAPSPEAPAVDALTTGAGADPMDVLLERLKSGGDYTAPLYTTNQGNEPKVLTRERLAVLVDHHKAHDGSVDSFELADSFIALMAHPASEPKALTVGQKDALWIAVELLNKADRPVDAEELRALLADR